MPEPAAELDALAGELYPVWLRYRPDLALKAGLPGYGRLLPAQEDDELAALRAWLDSFALALAELDLADLDADRRLDWELMAGAARIEREELGPLDWRRRDPLRLLPVAEIYRLTLEPPEELCPQLEALLAAVPEHLRQAQAQLRAAVADLAPELVRAAAREAEAGRCWLRELVRGSWLRRHCQGAAGLETLAEAACEALAALVDLLQGELLPRAGGRLGCGAEHLALRLECLHFMDWDPGDCAAPLAEALARTESELAGLGPDPAEPGAPAAEAVSGEARLALHRTLCDTLAREIESADLLDLPRARLRIRERPACPRPQGLRADYLADGEAFGTIYLSAPPPGDPGEPLESVRWRCLAQGQAGAHLFAFTDPGRARRLPRRLANAESLTRGFAHALDRRLAEVAGDLGRRRAALVRRRALLVRAELDLGLHGGGIDASEALARLAALDPAPAVGPGRERGRVGAELVRIALAPGDALAAALGLLLVESASAWLAQRHGAGFSVRRFHGVLAGQGAVPLPLVLRRGLGESGWEAARDLCLGRR
jgi:hypothetical protein